MFLLLIGLGLFGLFTAFILPWIVFYNQNQLEKKLNHLLRNQNLNSDRSSYAPYTPFKSSMPPSLEGIEQDTPKTAYTPQAQFPLIIDNKENQEQEAVVIPKTATKISFEEQFGKNLPVWGGGIALALAVFFLVKYSIDNNLLSPFVRVLLGSMFGFGLLYVSSIIRQKENFANGQRIAQSLAGAGIVALYIVTFAAAKLYDMVPLFLAFVLMGGVTATALVLSLRHGMPIAIMGLIGGFLTPVFLGEGGHNTAFLFGYLYLMIVGVHYLVKQSQQWWLSVLATGFGLLWVCVWLTLYRHGDGLWLGLFLIGLCIINVINSKKHFINNLEESFCLKNILKPASLLNYITLVISMIIMGFIVNISGFGILEWGLLSLLALGTIGLAYFDERLYGFAPWVSWGTIFVLLLSISVHNPVIYFLTVLGFGLIYALSSAVLVFRTQKPVSWACLCGINTIVFYLLAFFKTKYFNLFSHIPLAWGFLAFFLSIASLYMLSQIKEKLYDNPYKQHLYAVFATVATSFITLGLYIELPYEFLSVAVATQMLAIAWINQKVTIQALEKLIAVLAIVFGLILLPQFLLMIQLTLYSLTEVQWHLQASLPLVMKYPLFQLGIPAIMFLGTSYLLEPKVQNPLLIKIFESVSIGLIAIMGYNLTRTILNPNTNVLFVKAGFLEQGIITNVLILYGLLCLYVGRIYNRTPFSWGGIILIGAGLFRITYFDIVLYNPLWASQQIKGVSVFNTLLLPYGLPILWTYFAQKELILLNKQKWVRYLDAFKLVILFILLNLNVRYFFHGEFLNTGFCQNSEIYSYSVLWLLFGGGLLYTGTLWQDKALRVSSLGIILLAVTKVFLYDVSELDGLYRVFSFLGLGLCLMGVSYFYSRYVFFDTKK